MDRVEYAAKLPGTAWRSWFAGPAALALGLACGGIVALWPVPGMAVPAVAAALVLVTRRPEWLMLAFFTSLSIPIQRSVGGIPVNASDVLLVLWLVLWPWMALQGRAPGRAPWRMPRLVLAVLPFVAAVAAAQTVSIHPGASFKQMLRVIEWFVLLPMLLSVFRPEPALRQFFAATLMLVPCLFALDGVYEYFSHGQRLTGMIGIEVPVPEGGSSQIRHTFDVSGRAGSSFGGAQGLAMYLVMTMGVAIAHLLCPAPPAMKRLAWVGLCCSLAGLAAAQSRGGLLGAAAMLVAITLVLRPRWRAPLIFAALLLFAGGLVFLGLWSGWDGTLAGLVPGGRPEAVLDRLIIWGVVRDVALAHPLLGVGLGNFRDAFFAQEPWLNVALAYPSLHAHNTYLELLADTGMLGLLAYLGFLTAAARMLLARWHGRGRPALTLAALGSLAAYATFAMVDMLLLQNMHLLLMLVLSIGMIAGDATKTAGTPPAAKPGDSAP